MTQCRRLGQAIVRRQGRPTSILRRRIATADACNVWSLMCHCYFSVCSWGGRLPWPGGVLSGAVRWLTLLISLPASPTRHRVAAWRKLRRMGAVNLRGAAWILPETPETTELLQWLVQEVRSAKGEAVLLHVDQIEPLTDEQLRRLFDQAREADYQPIIRGCREAVGSSTAPGRAAQPAGTRSRRRPRGQARVERVRSIDYFDSSAASAPGDREALRSGSPPRARRQPAGASAGLVPPRAAWVTRPRPHIAGSPRHG